MDDVAPPATGAPCVLLLHAGIADSRMWRPQTGMLEDVADMLDQAGGLARGDPAAYPRPPVRSS